MSKTSLSSWLESLNTVAPNIFVVAEMANAHEGELELALEIVSVVCATGAQAIKFQCFAADELLIKQHPDYAVFQRLEMPPDDWKTLIDFAHQQGLTVFADVFGEQSATLMEDLGVDGFKVHSSDVSNLPLLEQIGSYGKPILLSAGGSTWLELCIARDTLKAAGVSEIIAVYGIQRFPTALEDSLINKLSLLGQKLDLPIGYADHIAGDDDAAMWLPLVAIGAGAVLVEKHITLDRSERGTDYFSALEPDEFAKFVELVTQARTGLGPRQLYLTEAELAYRSGMKKRPVAKRLINAGDRLGPDDIHFKRVPGDYERVNYQTLLGKPVRKTIAPEQSIRMEDVNMKIVATLACRVTSNRLYAKPLQNLGSKTIIEHLIERLQQVERLDEIVLAISEGDNNLAFVRLAEKLGLAYIIGDEKDVLGRLIKAADHVNGDIVLRVTTENPFIYYKNIDEIINHHLSVGADISVCEMLPNGSHVEIISLAALKHAHRYGEDRHRSELCTLFIFENPDLFRIEKLPAPEAVKRPDLRLTVDTAEDLVVAQKSYAALTEDGNLIALEDVIAFLDAHPKIRELNAEHHTMKLWK